MTIDQPSGQPIHRTVFVTGGRGKTGRAVTAELAGSAGVRVRCGSSQPDPGAEGLVAFDWRQPDTWLAALGGADAVYLMRPEVPDAPDLIARLIERAPDAHLVLLSEQGAESLPDDDWVRQVEYAVTANAASWTILRPSWFQQVLSDPRFYLEALRHERLLSVPTGGSAIAWVDVRDLASVAAIALHNPDAHHSQAYTLTGPESLTVDQVADCLSAELGRQVSSASPPRELVLDGLDPWTFGILDDLYRRVERGAFDEVTSTVRELTGRDASSMTSFIRANRHVWTDPS